MELRSILLKISIVSFSIGCTSSGVDRSQISQIESVGYPQQINLSNSTKLSRLDRSRQSPKLQILIPLYIYPNWYDRDKYLWSQVIVAAKKVRVLAIINPNNGPDRAPPNSDYQQGIKDLRQAGVKIIGYVPSDYARRDLQAVKADIDLYTNYFKVDGIFIDEVTSNLEDLSYYHKLYQYIKTISPQYLTIANPGTNIPENYITQPIADITVIFENTQKAWIAYRPPGYIKKYSPQHFAALVHSTSNRKLMKSTIDRAIKHQFGYIYITDDRTDTADRNPWDSLPEYWQAQVNYVQKLNSDIDP
jgi:Spherulation-specific family 4